MMFRSRQHSASLALCLLVLSGCATVKFDAPKEPSYAVWPANDTYLARRTARLADQNPERGGFYDLGDGVDALAARYVLARRAEADLHDPCGLFDRQIVAEDQLDHIALAIGQLAHRVPQAPGIERVRCRARCRFGRAQCSVALCQASPRRCLAEMRTR